MTREFPDPREKRLVWTGSSKRDLKAFPEEVQEAIGDALSGVQFGRKPSRAKPWKGDGPGVLEIVADHRGDTFRSVYTVRFEKAIYVLHAFQKKSKSGIATPRIEREMIAARLKKAEQHYKEHYD